MSASRNEVRPTAFERHVSTSTAVMATYPLIHAISVPGVLLQARAGDLLKMPLSEWPAEMYKTVFRNELYKITHIDEISGISKKEFVGWGRVFKDAKTLGNGYWGGNFYKFLQCNLRFPCKHMLHSYMTDNPQRFGQYSSAMLSGMSGTGAALIEGFALHPIDTWKNMLIYNKNKTTFAGMLKILREENIKLYRGLHWTLLRNSIGGFVQFGLYDLTKESISLTGYKKLDSLIIAFWASAMMIISTQPADNLKLRMQLGLDIERLISFKGAFYKALTKGIPPALLLWATDLFMQQLIEHREERKELQRNSFVFFQQQHDREIKNMPPIEIAQQEELEVLAARQRLRRE